MSAARLAGRRRDTVAEIQLNKPLYKEDPPASDGGAPAPAMRTRGARAGMLARTAAVALDLLAVHAVLMAVATFLPQYTVRLGYGGAWVGLGLAWVYLAVCGSAACGGRTLGKALLRLRISDMAGPDLPAGRAALRAALFLWPLAVYNVLNEISERADVPDNLGVVPGLWLLGLALVVGWLAGNLFYAMADGHGRTLYDRLTGSIVTTTDADLEDIQKFVRSAREDADPARVKRATVLLATTIAGLLAVTCWQLWRGTTSVAALPPDQREALVEYRRAVYREGFRFSLAGPLTAAPAGSGAADGTTATATADAATSVANYQLLRRGVIDVDALKSDPVVREMPVRLGQMARRELARARSAGTAASSIPPVVRFRVSFAELSHLLFAWNALEVFSVSAETRFDDLETTGSDDHTTGAELLQPVDSPRDASR
jgi:hypothetical protein